MGLLDDAIKEHLDLKRRRGADPAEVERDEREALGPVRRNQAPAAAESSEEPLAPLAPDDGLAYDQSRDDDWTFEAGEEPLGPAPGSEDAVGRADYVDDQLDDELEPLPPEPRIAAEDDELGGATAEYDVQGDLQRDPHPSAAEPGDDEDVLEETPEFLQDTPDHDRLWFEQRPPRDFDFDG
jgi:hypothetical protein